MKVFCAVFVAICVCLSQANEDEFRDWVRDSVNGQTDKRAITSALSGAAIMGAAKGFASNIGNLKSISSSVSRSFVDSCLGSQNNRINNIFNKPTNPWGISSGISSSSIGGLGGISSISKIGKRAEADKLNNRDVVFILDTSGSVPQDQFDKAKKSIVMLMEAYCPLKFGSEVTESGSKQVSVILFDNSVYKEVDFSEASKGFGFLQDKIMSMRHRKGSTATADALKYVRTNILGKGASRLTNDKVATDVIMITDGNCNMNCGGLGTEADAIRKLGHGVNLFAMGVANARVCELEIISGTGKDMAFGLGDFRNFDRFAQAVKEIAQENDSKCV